MNECVRLVSAARSFAPVPCAALVRSCGSRVWLRGLVGLCSLPLAREFASSRVPSLPVLSSLLFAPLVQPLSRRCSSSSSEADERSQVRKPKQQAAGGKPTSNKKPIWPTVPRSASPTRPGAMLAPAETSTLEIAIMWANEHPELLNAIITGTTPQRARPEICQPSQLLLTQVACASLLRCVYLRSALLW